MAMEGILVCKQEFPGPFSLYSTYTKETEKHDMLLFQLPLHNLNL